jgi:hypothetical protein
MKYLIPKLAAGVAGLLLITLPAPANADSADDHYLSRTPVATAYTGFCDTAAKHSERITCHQACDELMDRELCHTWEAIIDEEHGD